MSFRIKKRIFNTRNSLKLSETNAIIPKDQIHTIPNKHFPKNQTFWHFIIQTTAYLENIGNSIKDTLNSLNFYASCQDTYKIIDSIKRKEVKDNVIFIFLYIKDIKILPDNKYYIYNLEQYYRFKNTIFLDTVRESNDFMEIAYKKSFCILDYSYNNIPY